MIKYRLGDICNMKSGGTPTKRNPEYYGGSVPWVKISDFKNSNSDVITKTAESLTLKGLESINNRIFKEGTLFLAMYGSVGKTIFSGIEASCNQAILGITAKDKSILNLKYLRYWFLLNKEKLVNQARGGTLNNISATIVKNQEIFLPDILTQNKTVVFLEKANELLKKQEVIIEILDDLLKAQYFSLFGDSYYNTNNYDILTIQEICSSIIDCPHSTPKYVEEETDYPCIRTSEIKAGEINWESMKYLDFENHQIRVSRTVPKENDVLFGREGSVGDAALIPSNLNISLGQRVMLFRVNKNILTPEYFWALLLSNGVQFKIKTKTIGATVKRINIKEIKKIECPIPPLSEQKKFSFFVKKHREFKKQYLKSISNTNDLFNSLIQKAFSGKISIDEEVALESLLDEIDLDKDKNDVRDIAIAYLRELVEKINDRDFEDLMQYRKAKKVAFQLLESEDLSQRYNKKDKSVELIISQ